MHEGSVTIGSTDIDEPEVEVTLSGSAFLEALAVTPRDFYEATGLAGGPFTPESKTYTLSNTGDIPLNWTASFAGTWLTATPASGTIVVGDTVEVVVSFGGDAITLPDGLYTDEIAFTNIDTSVVRSREVTLELTLPLCDSVDNCELSWTTGGDVPWFGQSVESNDTVDAAQSGLVAHGQESWLETAVDVPGTLEFWARVSSEAGADSLKFYIDDVL
ncbi:MAG: hypothetical protein KAH38_04205, partial [Candidatus Hydrogenedentes bacterium]|nr:hypothetical protein [Candidatus Hydrogenedentota bacterium]